MSRFGVWVLACFLAGLSPAIAGAAEMYLPPPPRNEVGMQARLDLLRGDASRFNNEAGYGFSAFGHRQWGEVGPLALSAGLDAAFDRFAETVNIDSLDAGGRAVSYQDRQELTHTSFVVIQEARGGSGRWHAMGAGGAGVSVSHFFRPAVNQSPLQDKSALVPLLRAMGGVAYDAAEQLAIELEFTYNWLFSDDTVVFGKPFNDVVNVGLGVGYSF